MQKLSLLLLIPPFLLFAGCSNANVTVNGIKSFLGMQSTPTGYNIGAGESQMTNNGFVVKAKVIGFGSGNIVNGSYVTHGEITP